MKNKLIDADSYLKNFCNRFCSVKECTSTQKKSCCIAISLKDEPVVENVTDTNVGSKWIPCSERLPKNLRNYLTTLKDGDVEILEYNTRLNEWNDMDGHIIRDSYVVAWMPLPQPYKGE